MAKSFDFIGDVYPNLVTINTEDYYKTNGYHFGECNKDALTLVNQDPNVDFSDYDNWSFNSTTQQFEFTPDNYVDMIIMIYRTPDNDGGWFDAGEGDFNAIAVLSGSGNEFTLNFGGSPSKVKATFDRYISEAEAISLWLATETINAPAITNVIDGNFPPSTFLNIV